MSPIVKGMIAGFAATVVLSILMIIKAKMGMLPQLAVPAMLSGIVGAASPAVGWAIHFVIGTIIWGGLFSLLYAQIPGASALAKGVVFGIGAWILMMIIVMPLAGVGLFGLGIGIMAPVMTLILHVIYGLVLGSVYAAQMGGTASA